MKKIITTMCFAAALLTVGCHKDDNKPQPNGGSQQQTSVEGVYNPSAKIMTIEYASDPTEQWNWDGKLLQSISELNGDEGSSEKSHFTYGSGDRLERMTTQIAGMPAEVSYTYGGGKLTAISAISGDRELLSISVAHNDNGKISRLSCNVDTLMLNYLLSMLGDLSDMGFDIGDIINNDRMPSKGHDAKLRMERVGFTISMAWNGNNVSCAYIDANITASATRGEIEAMVSNIPQELLGDYSEYLGFLEFLPEEIPIPVTIAYKDTTDYTYDGHANPFYGFFGMLDMAVLSSANIATQHRHGVADFSATVTVPFLGEQTFNLYSYPVDNGVESFHYTYRPSGYPEQVSDANESMLKRYSYVNE